MSYITKTNFTEQANYIYQQFLGDYTKQPIRVTINNIINEWPSMFPPNEAMISSGTKAYMVSEIVHFFAPAAGIHAKQLKGDSTYVGSFMQNLVSATKNLRLWYEGVPRGTRVHGLDRPIADITKGLGKIALIATFPIATKYIFITNFVCELVGYSILISVENIQDRNGNVWDGKEWLEELSQADFWIDTGRRAFSQTLSAWFVMGYVVKPAEHYLGHVLSSITPTSLVKALNHDWALKDFPIVKSIAKVIHHNEFISSQLTYLGDVIKYVPYLGEYITKLRVNEIVIVPSIMNYLVNVVTGMIMVPTVRTSTYKINDKIKVIIQQNDLLSCMKIGDVFELAETSNRTITYNYDSYRVAKNTETPDNHFVCDMGKGKKVGFIESDLNSDDSVCITQIIVHYPREDDIVGKVINNFKNCANDPVPCFFNNVENAINVAQDVVDYGATIISSVLMNPGYAAISGFISGEIIHKILDGHLPGSTASIDME